MLTLGILFALYLLRRMDLNSQVNKERYFLFWLTELIPLHKKLYFIVLDSAKLF